ncbi:MAG: ATP synthase F1 subunit delta, partial [Polaribacter sp.]
IINIFDKIEVLNALFTGKVNNITLGLFHLLQDNKRIALLHSIAKQYVIVYDFLKHTQVAKVTPAVPLTKDVEKEVFDKVEALTGEKTNLENEINPAILGGFILRVGDLQYDASISNYLNELRREFDNSHYIPKI